MAKVPLGTNTVVRLRLDSQVLSHELKLRRQSFVRLRHSENSLSSSMMPLSDHFSVGYMIGHW